MDIPKSLEKYLVKDEIIEREFRLRERKRLYASNKRLFVIQRNKVTDYDYKHISSVEIEQERKWIIAVLGVILCAVGFIALIDSTGDIIPFIEDYIAWILLPFGVILIAIGFMKQQLVKLTVVGLTEPVPLKSDKSELEAIFKFVREKRI